MRTIRIIRALNKIRGDDVTGHTTITIHMGFDSCANVHYVGDKRLLRNYRSHRGLSVDGLGGNSHVRGIGDLPLAITCTDGSVQHIVLPDVFYIENNTACILSSFLFLDQCRELVHRVEILHIFSSLLSEGLSCLA